MMPKNMSTTKKKTTNHKSQSFPAALGYRMPAEWEKHEATWLAWPHNPETWTDLREIESIYIEIISLLVRGEKVNLLVNNLPEEERISAVLSKNKINLSQIRFFKIKTCDAWIRDYGPNFIVKKNVPKGGQLAVNRWIFNAWGGKYEEHKEDDKASREITHSLGVTVFEPGIVLEGGSIDSNGKGTILTTEECLLNPNRNSHLGKKEIEDYLKRYLAVQQIIWLKEGIEGDDTDGHIDDIARFVNANTVVAAVEGNRADPNYELLQENLKCLKKEKDQDGKKLSVIPLPMPERVSFSRERAPASYANFYIANAAVLVPIFGHPNDKAALKILKEFFPDRSVIGIRSTALVVGLGGIHCLTHEQPAV